MPDEAKPDASPAKQSSEVVETQPPKVDENGVHYFGDYPANHRLRAEALRKARLKHDPDGLITPEMIAAKE